jgi:hypothetical protein
MWVAILPFWQEDLMLARRDMGNAAGFTIAMVLSIHHDLIPRAKGSQLRDFPLIPIK